MTSVPCDTSAERIAELEKNLEAVFAERDALAEDYRTLKADHEAALSTLEDIRYAVDALLGSD